MKNQFLFQLVDDAICHCFSAKSPNIFPSISDNAPELRQIIIIDFSKLISPSPYHFQNFDIYLVQLLWVATYMCDLLDFILLMKGFSDDLCGWWLWFGITFILYSTFSSVALTNFYFSLFRLHEKTIFPFLFLIRKRIIANNKISTYCIHSFNMQKSVFIKEMKTIQYSKVQCCKRNVKDICKGLKEQQFIKIAK